MGVIKYLRRANKLCYRFGDKHTYISKTLSYLHESNDDFMECLHDLKWSPFENTRPCVARHVNNKIEHDTIFYNDDDCYKKA
jgi:hypothetical protein